MQHKLVLALVAILLAVMFIGEAMVYIANPYEYNSQMDGNEYSVHSSVSADFSIIQFSNPLDIEKVYVYCDKDYASPLGVSPDEAREFVRELELRGQTARIVDADELASVMGTADPTVTALVFPDGGLPDTVYSASPSDLIVKWFDNGGLVYWVGPAIGKYICTKEKVEEVGTERYSLFFPEGTLRESESDLIGTTPDAGLGKALCIRCSGCTYGIKESTPDTVSLGYTSTDGYCAVAVTKLRNGQVTMVEGFGDNGRTDLAQLLASGTSYNSELIHEYTEHCHSNTKTGTITSIAGTSVYIFAGGYYTCYGKTYII